MDQLCKQVDQVLLLHQVVLLFLKLVKSHEEVEKQNKTAARSCAVCHLVSAVKTWGLIRIKITVLLLDTLIFYCDSQSHVMYT